MVLVGAEGLEGRGGFGSSAELLVLVLELVELPVEATVREQLLVGAAFAEVALVHDEDGVGALDG